MKYSETLWRAIEPIYQAILHHPFNQELANGVLERKRFDFYLEQDAYYLKCFARVLALIASRMDSSTDIQQFLHFALETLISERELHTHYLKECDPRDFEPSPACIGYVQHLMALAATGSIEEAVAATLPCPWIYQQMGCALANHATQENPYARWIETYAAEEFTESTHLAISLLDQIASQCTENMRTRMAKAFEYSALYEWHFWNDAYQMTVFRHSVNRFDPSNRHPLLHHSHLREPTELHHLHPIKTNYNINVRPIQN